MNTTRFNAFDSLASRTSENPRKKVAVDPCNAISGNGKGGLKRTLFSEAAIPNKRYHVDVNDEHRMIEVDPETPLLYVLRDELGLDGPKFGCGLGQCGACTIHLDGEAIRSCLYPVGSVGNRKVTTVEGLSVNSEMSPLQKALLEAQAPQCGYCMSGIMMTASALLRKKPHASDADIRGALDGNLCRCACHLRVLRAIKAVVEGTI